MASCTSCPGIESQFDGRVARRDLRRYRRRGPDRTTRSLLEALRAAGVERATLLDVGGGVGVIAHELLGAGAASATLVEAAAAYVDAARDEARRCGHADRLEVCHGDFAELAAGVAPADIVTLDRVICCYPDRQRLVAASAARARRLYGAVYPRDTWWVRLGLRLTNWISQLRGSLFRVYLHPPEGIHAELQDEGLRRRFWRRTFVWEVAVYER